MDGRHNLDIPLILNLVPLPQDAKPPLLSEMFKHEPSSPSPPSMSIGSLARALNVMTAELLPFISAGYIRLTPPHQSISSHSTIQAIPESAVSWMRSWFLPVYAKGLFSIDNMADLLNILPREVLPLAAAHEVPVMRDAGVGFVFSTWGARTLLLRSIRGRDCPRFDRQAALWSILAEDPEKAATPPPFSERLEKELERVAKLEEPARSLRSVQLITAMEDAYKIATSIRGAKIESAPTDQTSGSIPTGPSPEISEPLPHSL